MILVLHVDTHDFSPTLINKVTAEFELNEDLAIWEDILDHVTIALRHENNAGVQTIPLSDIIAIQESDDDL